MKSFCSTFSCTTRESSDESSVDGSSAQTRPSKGGGTTAGSTAGLTAAASDSISAAERQDITYLPGSLTRKSGEDQVAKYPTWAFSVNKGYGTATTHAGIVYLKHSLEDELAEYTDGGLELEVFMVVQDSIDDMIKAGEAEKKFFTQKHIIPKPLIVIIKLNPAA